MTIPSAASLTPVSAAATPAGRLIVAKFGGTSVATAAQLRKVKAIIDADPARRITVPSAPGKAFSGDTKITDLLYLTHELAAKGQDVTAVWDHVAGRFTDLAKGLALTVDLQPELVATRACIIAIATAGGPADYAASRGEAINGRIVAALLSAEYIDAAEVVFFDRTGRLDAARTYAAIASRTAGTGRYVIPGFYGTGDDSLGVTPEARVKTFSRGGSDVTGAIVARAVNAQLYENWTDVSGFLMTDPRIVPEAKTITEVTYSELRELSYMGASVLHEEAVFPVRETGIPINIRNTNRPDDAGTMIVRGRDPGHQVVVGIAGTKGFTVINVEKAMMNGEIGFGRRVLDCLERHGIPYEHTPTGIDTLSLVIADRYLNPRGQGSKLDEVIDDIRAAVKPDAVNIAAPMALIATVGQGMVRATGTAARLFSALAKARVNVRMIDQGSSEQNIIVGVEEGDLATAIRAISNEFA